jgi:hypothetical protein
MKKLNRREFVQTTTAAAAAAAAASKPLFAQAPTMITPKSAKPCIVASGNGNRSKDADGVTCVAKAFKMMTAGADVLDALVAGVAIVELDPNQTGVGWSGLPNAEGVVQLDASCMHGPKKRAGEVLRAFADQQMMIGLVGHQLRDARRRAHALDSRNSARALLRAVHARGVELDDAFGVRQAAPADAGLIRIELDDGDAGDERVEDVGAAGHHLEHLRDARDAVRVLRSIAVARRDDARLHALRRHHRRRLAE